MTAAEVLMDHPLGPTTVEDWLVADQPADGSRLELYWGYYHVSPAPGGRHQQVSFQLASAINAALRASGRDDLNMLQAVAVRLSTLFRTGVIPDICVLDVEVDHASFSPENLLLAVEIRSPGNTEAERKTKMATYADAGVPFLWTVEFPARKPAVLTAFQLRPGGYRQQLRAANDEIVVAPGPVPVEVDTSALLA